MKTILLAASLFFTTVGGARSSELQTARDRNLDLLHAYATAGEFPQNVDSRSRTLYFLDPEGRPCAVAYLMQQAGYGDAVAQIARTNNAVKVTPDVTGPIADWIRVSGFTVQDVMRIQEPDGYGYSGPREPARVAVIDADRARIQKRLFRVIDGLRKS